MGFELLPDLFECCDPIIGPEPLHGLVRDQADIQIFRETRGQPVVGHQRRAALDGERCPFGVEALHGSKRTANDQVLLRPGKGVTALESVKVGFDFSARWRFLHRLHGNSLLPVCYRPSVWRLEHGLHASFTNNAAAGPVQPPHRPAGLLAVAAHRFARQDAVAELRHHFRHDVEHLGGADTVDAVADARQLAQLAVVSQRPITSMLRCVWHQFRAQNRLPPGLPEQASDSLAGGFVCGSDRCHWATRQTYDGRAQLNRRTRSIPPRTRMARARVVRYSGSSLFRDSSPSTSLPAA